jgi:hypothetical protein
MCRADYALGKAIRDGQQPGENHTVATRGEVVKSQENKTRPGQVLSSVNKFATNGELYGHSSRPGILALADNASPDEFESALTEAKAEGNLSRADYVVGGRIVCYKCFHCNVYFS